MWYARAAGVILLSTVLVWLSTLAFAAELSIAVVGPNLKIRPGDRLPAGTRAELWAGRNEFEPFQIALTSTAGPTAQLSARLARPLAGSCGTIPAENVTLYRQHLHHVAVPSFGTSSAGPWPDALIPDVDPYLRQKRAAFPFDVPAGETRALWVDVLVPQSAAAGDYQGAIEILAAGTVVGTVAITLHVGDFTLPSTATLASAYFLEWNQPCRAHTGTHSCGPDFNVARGSEKRALYVRSALEHRFTIAEPHFQPPFGGGAEHFERIILPYINGTAPTRLPGARLTSIRIDNDASTRAAWAAYATRHGFVDRLFSYEVDEPGNNVGEWVRLIGTADAFRKIDPAVRTIITSTIVQADAHGATGSVDIFAPVINYLDNKPGTGLFEGDQTRAYAAWRAADPRHRFWAYESCMSHGCGKCGATHTDPHYQGWPQKVIDASAVQNRCFPWLAFRFGVEGELYYDAAIKLDTAWERNGLCAFSGEGDGTVFYPGKPSVIGGRDDIPIESIRMKLIREGMEDYEYLHMARARHGGTASELASRTVPHAYSCDQQPEVFQRARQSLFQLLSPPSASGACRTR